MSKTGLGEYFSIGYCFAGEEEKIPTVLDLYVNKQIDLNDVNRVLELHNINLFFKKYDHIVGWDEEKYNSNKKIAECIGEEIKVFFLNLTEDMLVRTYDKCDVIFWDDFWRFFYQFEVYKKISKERFNEIIDELKMSANKLLEHKDFVRFFESEVTEKMCDPEFGATFLIDYFLSARNENEKYYLPKSLSPEMIYKTVMQYVTDVEFVNANRLALIINSKSINNKMFSLDDKLRYKAQQRYQRIWEEIEKSGQVIIKQGYGVNIEFTTECEDCSCEFKNGYIKAQYSSLWVEENMDYPTLLNNFIYLFEYVDSQMRCKLTNTCFEKGVFESIFSINGNGMYRKGETFNLMNMLANAQIHSYMGVLSDLGTSLEEICIWFFEEYLKEEFGAEGFICNIPKNNTYIWEKCKLISSAMDGVIKQYKMFVEEHEIDRGFYVMSSTPVSYRDLPSYSKNKYAYVDNQNLVKEMNMLFSNQSHLFYIEKAKNKYSSLVGLINGLDCTIEDFYEYQKRDIHWLIEQGSLLLSNNKLSLNNTRVYILRQFYDSGFICLPHFRSSYLKMMIQNGDIRTDSSLLSLPEYQYIDFILNKREFSNGLDLRNKYIHDSITTDERIQHQDYAILMKVMIILIIKMNDEFCIRDEMNNGEEDFYEL
ncbi:hypothetical protein SAMN02910289_00311 [Lachnospiraceae bacterium RM5]|nr:hypothetical protein SAMN02910289_00311 [Lachnospiraceae bacterium RM5]